MAIKMDMCYVLLYILSTNKLYILCVPAEHLWTVVYYKVVPVPMFPLYRY